MMHNTTEALKYVVPRQDHVDLTSRFRGLILIGPPGIGKTSAVTALLPHAPLVRISMAAKLPEDMATYPVPIVENGRATIFHALSESSITPLLKEHIGEEVGVLLLDDIGLATERTQSALLELIQFGRIGEYELGLNVLIALTTNGIDDGAHATSLSTALLGRCQIVRFNADFNAWKNYPCNTHIDPSVIAFLSDRPDMFSPTDRRYFDDLQKGPSPRDWTTLGHAIASWGGYDGFKPNPMYQSAFAFVAGNLGEVVASEFVTFIERFRHLPRVDDLLENPALWRSVPQEHNSLANGLSISFALRGKVISEIGASQNNDAIKTYIGKCLNVVGEVAKGNEEIFMFFLKSVMDYGVAHNMRIGAAIAPLLKSHPELKSDRFKALCAACSKVAA